MALQKSTLKQKLQSVLDSQPSSVGQAASDWANAYLAYAQAAMSSMSTLPVAAAAGLGTLVSAFNAGFQTQSSSGAAGQIAQGVMSFWTAQVWVGPGFTGTTTSPGNSALTSALGAIFADTGESSNADKAGQLADAFDAGAKLVIVADVSISTGVTTPGPIS